MIVIHPKAFTHTIVSLLGPIRRGKRLYPAGYQFAAQGPIGSEVVSVVDMDGLPLVVRADRLQVLSVPRAVERRETPTVAKLLARGVLRRASELN